MMNRKEFTKQVLIASALTVSGAGARRFAQKNDFAAPLADMLSFKSLFNGKNRDGFVNVNTSEHTWWVENGLLKCTGEPIGVMRTEQQFENFILDIEWRHAEPGGNSGVFVWADGEPFEDTPFPTGMEVQMLDPEWPVINERPVEYAHGHLFPVMGLEGTTPDNPSEAVPGRSYSLENRVRPAGEWNRYIVVCVDGTLKLSINGKFVNGIRSPNRKKGYICPESEGSEIHFRKIDILELPGSVLSEDQAAPIVKVQNHQQK